MRTNACFTLPVPLSRKVLSPRRSRVVLLSLLGAAIFTSCSPTANKCLTSANAWAFHYARYQEACVPQGSVECACRYEALDRWRRALDEANAAMSRGGKMPLQLQALEDAKRALEACK